MAVFFSFHYERDAWRVQQVMNMGVVEGQLLLKSQDWESVKRKGDTAIKSWIEQQMKGKSAVIVLIGAKTAERPWVRYEIAKAWDDGYSLLGVNIHGLTDSNHRTDTRGANPFAQVALKNGKTVADYVPVFDPVGRTSTDIYAAIKANLPGWSKQGRSRG